MGAYITLSIVLLMWLINKWLYQTIDAKTEFLYAVLEENIYTNMPEGIVGLLSEHYSYHDILVLIKCIYGLV